MLLRCKAGIVSVLGFCGITEDFKYSVQSEAETRLIRHLIRLKLQASPSGWLWPEAPRLRETQQKSKYPKTPEVA